MSLLPQRKKSAEEIAKLRESLGIPGLSPEEEMPVGNATPAGLAIETPTVVIAEKISEPPPPSPLAPIPLTTANEPKPVRSLKRSERMPVLPVDDSEPLPHLADPAPVRIPASSPLPVAPGLRPVRSLRKSEQAPLPAQRPEPSPDSSLPIHRHSDRELNDLRRRDALTALAQEIRPPSLSAHFSVIIAGYLSVIAAGVFFHFYDLAKELLPVTAAGVAVSLICAGFIFFKKPLSRHHAAFISVAALFVIVFGTLHYFPQLRYGT